jgi:hypothetical protein
VKGRGEDRTARWLYDRLERAALDATVSLRLHPQRESASNACPDFLLLVEVRVPLLPGRALVFRVPALVEVEACSDLDGAMADLERFVERSGDGSGRQEAVIELPFVALTRDGGEGDGGRVGDGRRAAPCGRQRTVTRRLPVRFEIVEAAMALVGWRR